MNSKVAYVPNATDREKVMLVVIEQLKSEVEKLKTEKLELEGMRRPIDV